MTLFVAGSVLYGVGFVAWLIRLGFIWDDIDWNDVGPLPVLACFIWPLAVPVAIGKAARKRAKQRVLAEKERRKWLEAPIP